RILTITGLDLDRRDPFTDQGRQTLLALCGEHILSRRARRAKRRLDSAARARNVGVTRAMQTLLEFLGTVAGVNEMRMAIDQSRRSPASAAIDVSRRGRAPWKLACRTDPCDPIAPNPDCRVSNRSVPRRVTHRGGMHIFKNQ